MEDCLQVATEFVQNRILFKKPLASFQLTQNKLYQMSRNLAGAQLLAVQLAKLKGSENLKPFQISLGKQSNVEAALSTARAARELLGGTGILSESRVMRHACNLETVHTYEGTSDIHKLIVGLELTGENAFG
jgi:glutaryl-CoA dehydrogenase